MTEEALTQALDEVERGQGDKIMATLANMWVEPGERIGIEKGERIGIEKGERIGIEKMIIRMLERGNLSREEIASEVGLPVAEIERIDQARQSK